MFTAYSSREQHAYTVCLAAAYDAVSICMGYPQKHVADQPFCLIPHSLRRFSTRRLHSSWYVLDHFVNFPIWRCGKVAPRMFGSFFNACWRNIQEQCFRICTNERTNKERPELASSCLFSRNVRECSNRATSPKFKFTSWKLAACCHCLREVSFLSLHQGRGSRLLHVSFFALFLRSSKFFNLTLGQHVFLSNRTVYSVLFHYDSCLIGSVKVTTFG